MKHFTSILAESKGPIREEELVPGFTFYVLSADGYSASRYRITGEVELNVGPVLKVKHAVIAGEKFKQDMISRDFVLGRKGNLQVFRDRKSAIAAYKTAGLRREM